MPKPDQTLPIEPNTIFWMRYIHKDLNTIPLTHRCTQPLELVSSGNPIIILVKMPEGEVPTNYSIPSKHN